MFNFLKKKAKAQFPPVPDWKPTIRQPLDQIIERLSHYTDYKHDLAVFEHGTCVILPSGLSEQQAISTAEETLSKIFNYHPDMNPLPMNDGNVLVQYNHPAVNIVLKDVATRHWAEIDRNHQRALATGEVLITPLGQNVFDEFGKMVLFGRCFMFMDAEHPKVVKVVRNAA